MLEPTGYRGHGRKFLTVADALAELVDDAWTYPDPESFARLLQAVAGGEPTPGELVSDPDLPVPKEGAWYQSVGGGERSFIRELDFAEALTDGLARQVAPVILISRRGVRDDDGRPGGSRGGLALRYFREALEGQEMNITEHDKKLRLCGHARC